MPVFPCFARDERIGGKLHKAKSPRTPSGFKDASRNIEQIAQWWEKWPDALVGVPTGAVSNLLVIDVDPDGEGWYSENSPRLACGRVHKTRRGHHLLYRMPNGEIRNSTGALAKGIDVRGEGGYIVWWPAHGLESVGDLEDLKEPPKWLVHDLLPRANERVQLATVGREGPGARNSTLTKLAGSMRRAGFSAAAIGMWRFSS